MRAGSVVICVSLFVACVLSISVEPLAQLDTSLAIEWDLIDYVNQAQKTWTAGRNERFYGKTVGDVKKLCGVPLETEQNGLEVKEIDVPAAIPDTFDSRTQWPTCVGAIRDQGHCGSCWAFGAVESLADRICIQSQGKTTIVLSAQDLTSCDASNSGCNGGYPSAAWKYMQTTGVVSETCYPYEMGTCQHPGCSEEPTPKCKQVCGNSAVFTTDKRHAKSAYAIARNVSQIQTEIMTNGPVEGTFTVYVDFNTYKSGVYYHVSGAAEGGHAIKIIGWGTENGVAYWLVANSWNTSWGDQGFFKIRRGTNECGIEAGITAGLANI